MLRPILHSIRNQPGLWLVNSERIRSSNDIVYISLGKKTIMARPVDKVLTKWEKIALNRAIKYWKKKKIQRAVKQVNATQHQR